MFLCWTLRLLRPSKKDGFDTVFFFDQSREFVLETRKRIPGANGFTGDFVETVLGNTGEETHLADESDDALSADRDEPDTKETRRKQRLRDERAKFMAAFPFDVINLDLEEFLFKPNELIPGRLITAMRKRLRGSVGLWPSGEGKS